MSEEFLVSWENFELFKTHFKSLKEDIAEAYKDEKECAEEAEFILLSLDNLLEELDSVKSKADLTKKKCLKIDALVSWISQNVSEGDEIDDIDDEDFELFFDEEDFEEIELDEVKPKKAPAPKKAAAPKKKPKK